MAPRTIYSVGHSSLALDAFLQLLESFGIRRLGDVRRFPRSRRYPHFDALSLSVAAEERGIGYRHFEDLGGYREKRDDSPHRVWEVAGFQSYADHMDSAMFRDARAAFEAWMVPGATAFMCAERSWRDCHRQLLSDALVVGGHPVSHILGPEKTEKHALPPFARRDGDRIVYDGGLLRFE